MSSNLSRDHTNIWSSAWSTIYESMSLFIAFAALVNGPHNIIKLTRSMGYGGRKLRHFHVSQLKVQYVAAMVSFCTRSMRDMCETCVKNPCEACSVVHQD